MYHDVLQMCNQQRDEYYAALNTHYSSESGLCYWLIKQSAAVFTHKAELINASRKITNLKRVRKR
jgi:hypothetical protein